MNTTFGFKDIKKPEGEGGADRKLNLSKITIQPPPTLTEQDEEHAIRIGESLGFVSREGSSQTNPRQKRRKPPKKKIPQGRLVLTGPQHLIDSFIAYTNDSGAASYLQAIEALMKGKEGVY